METILNFIDDVMNTLKENPHLFWIVVGCVVALIVLIVLLVVLNSKKKQTTEEPDETKLIKETLRENEETLVEEETAIEVVEDAPVEEVPAAEEVVEATPVVEEVAPKKTTRKKAVKKEEPVAEETPAEEAPVVEEAPVAEEVVEEVAPKKTTKKKTVKKEEPVVEETPAEEAPVVEEETAETKKTRVVYGKYEVYSDGTSFFYNLKASNGEILIKSEAYASKESVLAAIESIKRNVEVGTISVRQDKHGLYQFLLVAKNHRRLVMSANYSTEKRATSASESFKRFAANSPIVELAEIVESSKEEVKVENIVDKKGGKIGVITTENGYYYYVLKASNGEILVHSDNYKTLLSAEAAMKRFQESVFTGKFYVEKDKRDNYQFKLFGPSGRIVCVGQIYATKALAIASINSVCSFVKLATPIEE